MRCIAFRILLAITGLVAISTIEAAQAREPVQIDPFQLPAILCGFPIDVGVVLNNEFQDVVTLDDGTQITHITGNLVLSFTNTDTGFTITRELSGPTTRTEYPNGTGVFVGEGLNWFGFGPNSQKNTGQPGIVFTRGLVTLTFNGNVINSFALKGKQENGCNLLKG